MRALRRAITSVKTFCVLPECASTEYECDDGKCLERAWLCDGYEDCSTGEDELNCSTLYAAC